jgi:multidrug transporter EmrE-like cation transporter
MKVAYQVFTVILWITIALAGFLFFMQMSRINNVSLPVIIGGLLGVAVVPGIVWLIRYFIGKKLKK